MKPQYRTLLGLKDLRPAIKSNPTYIEPVYDENIQGRVLLLDDWRKTPSTWFDHGGNNNGTVYGAGTPPPATPQALGYLFDGVDDYVDVVDIALTNFTVSGWIKRSGANAANTIQTPISMEDMINKYFRFDIQTNNVIVLYIYDGTTHNIGATAISDNTWYYITATWSGNTNTFYLNGVQKGTGDCIPSASVSNGFLGTRNGGGVTPYYFNGTIDEVRIWNRALNANEIWSHYIKYKGKFGL